MRIGAAITIVGVLLVVVSVLVRPFNYVLEQPQILLIFYLGVLPISLAVGLVVIQWHWWFPAFIIGALTTFGIIVLVVLPDMLLELLSGGFEPGEKCDGFCSAGDAFGFVLIIVVTFAAATAVVGGFICALVSLVYARPRLRWWAE